MFQAENTEIVGISANAAFSQKAFADFAKINYALLSDRDGKVMQAYGVYDEPRKLAKRSYVIIDKDGVVRYLNIRPSNTEKDLLSTEQLLNESKESQQRELTIISQGERRKQLMVQGKLLVAAMIGFMTLLVSSHVFAQAEVIEKRQDAMKGIAQTLRQLRLP